MPTPIADDRFLYVDTGAQGGLNRPLYSFVAWFQ
jgi:hypothetical protein